MIGDRRYSVLSEWITTIHTPYMDGIMTISDDDATTGRDMTPEEILTGVYARSVMDALKRIITEPETPKNLASRAESVLLNLTKIVHAMEIARVRSRRATQ